MKLAHEILNVRTKHPFTIARGSGSDFRVVWVKVTDDDGNEGWGESAPSRYYGESVDMSAAALMELAPIVERWDGWSLESAEEEMTRVLRGAGAAKSAVSAALHDLVGKRLGVPLWKLWGLDPTRAPRSSFTIGIADTDGLRRKVREAEAFPILKVKLGTERDEEIIRTIRDCAPRKTLRVDANAAWTPKQALRMIPLLAELGVELVEQPLPGEDLEGLRFVRERSSLPIIADESCVTSKDIPRLVGVVDGINIKLAKCGGLREALRMIAIARAHGMLVMLGCMIETSLGITMGAHLAPLLDYADLDGALLLANDPFVGATMDGGEITLPDAPGLGVRRA
jgi:L-Ala-D/L-Glu epimerase